MTEATAIAAEGHAPSYPRYYRIAGHWVNSYKVFLCVGIYAGILASAAVGARSGISPLRLGAGLLLFALAGLVGARAYHLAVNLRDYRETGLSLTPRRPGEGGWGVLGGLVIVPISLLFDSVFGIPIGLFWDHMAISIAVGGGWVRYGCVRNGCCIGRDSERWLALRQHDLRGEYRRRVPAQWLEIGWWILACAGLLWLWPLRLPPGSYAFAVLAWYGAGRVWLEPLRAHPSVVRGVLVNRVVAAAMAVVASAGFVWRVW